MSAVYEGPDVRLLLDEPDAQVWCGDSRRVLRTLPPASVHLLVTSPPYWNRVAYSGGGDGQLGDIDDYPAFLAALNEVWDAAVPLFVPGGVVAVNMPNLYPKVKSSWGEREVQQRLMIAASLDIANYFLARGFTLQEWIIWAKFGSLRRDATGQKRRIFGSYPYPGFIYTSDTYEPIVVLRAPGQRTFDREARAASKLTIGEWRQVCDSIWYVTGEHDPTHPAVWPGEIPSRLIRMYTCKGETVLDPFAGCGRTLLEAAKLGRRGIGVDVSRQYAEEQARRCSQKVLVVA